MSFDEIETWEVKLPGLAMFVLGKKIFIFPKLFNPVKRIGLDTL